MSAAGGMKESVVEGRTGYLVPPLDAEAYAKAVTFLLNNGELRKVMGNRAASYVVEHFAFEKTVVDIERLYGTVLECK